MAAKRSNPSEFLKQSQVISTRSKRIMALVPEPASSELDSDGSDEQEIFRDKNQCYFTDEEDSDGDITSDAPTLPEELENLLKEIDSYTFENPCRSNNTVVENITVGETNYQLKPVEVSGHDILIAVPPLDTTEHNETDCNADSNELPVLTDLNLSTSDNSAVLNNTFDLSPLIPNENLTTQLNTKTRASTAPTKRKKQKYTDTVLKKQKINSNKTNKKSRKVKTIKRKVLMKNICGNIEWKSGLFVNKPQFEEKIIPVPEKIKTCFEYFKIFFPETLFDLIVDNTNLYSVQKTGKSINVSKNDICDFISILIRMGIVQMPSYLDYWSNQLRYDKVADIMSLKRFQQIRRFLHFVNNDNENNDRYFKIRPLVETIRQCCLSIDHEHRFSIDEMMVPYKGRKAGSRKQYIPSKPKKWGFKIFVRSGVSGLIYDFLIYGGDSTFSQQTFNKEEEQFGIAGKTVITLCKSIPNPGTSVVYFDNFFSSLNLVQLLRNEFGIFSLGTIRCNKTTNVDLPDQKSMKKSGRGTFSQVASDDLVIVRWLDNKPVTLVSSYTDAYPVTKVKRYSKENKARIDIPCPNIVAEYNKHMGGVDLSDMLIALYRIVLKTRRWYLQIFAQMLDISLNNAWLLRRRELLMKNIKNEDLTLKEFRLQICESLQKKGQSERMVRKVNIPQRVIKVPVTPRPSDEKRYDLDSHFPSFTTRGRCKYCVQGQTAMQCNKCNVRLCLKERSNCFIAFHSRK